MLLQDVKSNTAQRHLRAASKLEVYLRQHDVRGGAVEAMEKVMLVKWTSDYLRDAFRSQELSVSMVGDTISGLNRLCFLAQSLGFQVAAQDASLRPLWKLHRNWQLAIPGEFRTPASKKLTLAVAVFFEITDQPRLSLLVVLCIHCLLRPRESCLLRRGDVVTLGNTANY